MEEWYTKSATYSVKDVFHLSQIIQMVPNRANRHMCTWKLSEQATGWVLKKPVFLITWINIVCGSLRVT